MSEREDQIRFCMWVATMMGILVLLAVLTGCSSKRQTVVERRDSIVERTIHTERIDTLIVSLPAQSVERIAHVDSSWLETDVAMSGAWILPDGTLRHTLRNRPTLTLPVTTTADTIVRYVDRYRNKVVEVERKPSLWEQVKSATWWWLVVAVGVMAMCLKSKK